MKKLRQELYEFASQRAVADVALGIIIGAALSNLVNVIVEEIILPPISFVTQGINLENKAFILREAGSIDGVIPMENIAIGYGRMIEVSIEFIVIGLAVFFLVKSSRVIWKKTHALQTIAETPKQRKEVELLEQTVSLLQKQNALLERTQEQNKPNL